MKTLVKRTLIAAVFAISLASLAKADLPEQVDAIISSQKGVHFSVRIIRVDSGKTIYSHEATTALVPASNMKIIITAAALKYLGPDYQYETKVGLCGDTLVVIGSGDPLLGDERTDLKYGRERDWIFKDIAERLKRKQVQTIEDIVVDTTIFDDEPVHPSWPRAELNRWYACEVSGLNFNDNCIEVTTKNIGETVAVSIEPQTNFVEIINEVEPISEGTSAVGAYRNQTPNKVTIHGRCRKEAGPFYVAIERPAAFFGVLLAENLARAGINAAGEVIERPLADDCDVKVLAEFTTLIADCLARCNKRSLNLAAEALLKTIAAQCSPSGKNGSWPDGREAVSKYLLQLGIDKDEFYIDDGSGLSRQNKLSANAVTTVLFSIYKTNNWNLYKDSLAVGGVDGTIATYFKDEKYKGKILGKTGYLRGVRSFSGTCSTADGDYIFSILTNKTNSQTRKAIYDIAKAIVDEADI
jgi:D-alanyl-D-alanine carboxypeptidase/D-alanyl-D-alanine-endopeptidase (penicillin-binding protein 4)